MREIKFRSWDIDRKKMCDVHNLAFHADYIYKAITIEQELGLYSTFVSIEKFELMQYTGLKDKNGVEIFEGDIVFDRWANAYTPVFQNGIYMAYNPKNLMQNDPSTQFNIIWRDGCEIIGNIYENPDLLEV